MLPRHHVDPGLAAAGLTVVARQPHDGPAALADAYRIDSVGGAGIRDQRLELRPAVGIAERHVELGSARHKLPGDRATTVTHLIDLSARKPLPIAPCLADDRQHVVQIVAAKDVVGVLED